MINAGALSGFATSVISGVGKKKLAKDQLAESEQLQRDHPRPDYQIPEEALDYYNALRLRAGTGGYAGQGVAEDKIRAGTVGAINKAAQYGQDPASIMATIGSAYQGQQGALLDSAVIGAKQDNADWSQLGGFVPEMAAYRTKQFEWDQVKPYEQAMAAASALKEASIRNKESGNNDIFNGFNTFAGSNGGIGDVGTYAGAHGDITSGDGGGGRRGKKESGGGGSDSGTATGIGTYQQNFDPNINRYGQAPGITPYYGNTSNNIGTAADWSSMDGNQRMTYLKQLGIL